jgi:hypothetical protein
VSKVYVEYKFGGAHLPKGALRVNYGGRKTRLFSVLVEGLGCVSIDLWDLPGTPLRLRDTEKHRVTALWVLVEGLEFGSR